MSFIGDRYGEKMPGEGKGQDTSWLILKQTGGDTKIFVTRHPACISFATPRLQEVFRCHRL